MIINNLDGTFSVKHSKFQGQSFPTKAAATAAIMSDLSIVYALQAAEQASARMIVICDQALTDIDAKLQARYVRAAAQV